MTLLSSRRDDTSQDGASERPANSRSFVVVIVEWLDKRIPVRVLSQTTTPSG